MMKGGDHTAHNANSLRSFQAAMQFLRTHFGYLLDEPAHEIMVLIT